MSAGAEGDAFWVAKERELENIAGIAGRGESGVGAAETRGREADSVRFRAGRVPMGCKFCATGMLGFNRNLSAGEIVAQVLFFSRYLKQNETEHNRVTNVVFMGMGEPLLNYDQVMEAVSIFNSKDAFTIGARRISISTAGIIPGIEKLMREEIQINLAISLHAATDELRSELMPINKQYPLEDLMNAVARFGRAKNREVMFEYLLIKGINDREEDALALVELMRDGLFMVNLIRYNPTGVFEPSSSAEIARLQKYPERKRHQCHTALQFRTGYQRRMRTAGE